MRSSQVPIPGTQHSGSVLGLGLVLFLTASTMLLPCWFARAGSDAAGDTAQIPTVPAPSNVTIESNPQLFATMCGLHAAGFEADVSAVGFHPVRARLGSELLRQQGPAAEALRAYYREHVLADPAASLSRYVSFALLVGPPPQFNYLLRHDELPPDVLAIEDFNEVLAKFYREAQIERIWARVQPEYNREIERLHGPVTQVVMTSTAYLRELLKAASPRTFTVYVEPMVGGKTNFRNYGHHYAIVLSPGGEPPVDEIRHAFLHFLLDPLAVRYPALVAGKRSLLDLAARAPRLPTEFKEDFPSFFTECLVRAVELRLRRLPPDKLAAATDEVEADGYVLVRPFLRELSRFEKAEPAMSFYFPDLVRRIDVAQESQRLQRATFAAATPGGAEAPGPALGAQHSNAAEPSELDRWLAEGEREIAMQNAAAAVAAFERVLSKYPQQPRALYGLAVAAVLQGDVDRAKKLFLHLVINPSGPEANPAGKDTLILAWSHVYLGRIHDVDGERELAVSEYRAALAVEGAPESARLAARRGIEKGYEATPRNRDTGQQRP